MLRAPHLHLRKIKPDQHLRQIRLVESLEWKTQRHDILAIRIRQHDPYFTLTYSLSWLPSLFASDSISSSRALAVVSCDAFIEFKSDNR